MRAWSAAALMLIALPLLAADDAWRTLAHPAHTGAIDAAHERALAAIASMPADAYGRDEIPDVRHLLDRPTREASFEKLLGTWRCRSIQIGALGLFSYPPFRCEIVLTEDGTLEFSKTSGSQRRHGQLYPYTASGWVFMGGTSVNNEPYRSYSARNADSDGPDVAGDSVGLLETLADGRLRVLLDARDDQVEIYELKR